MADLNDPVSGLLRRMALTEWRLAVAQGNLEHHIELCDVMPLLAFVTTNDNGMPPQSTPNRATPTSLCTFAKNPSRDSDVVTPGGPPCFPAAPIGRTALP